MIVKPMTAPLELLPLRPIGYVRNAVGEPQPHGWEALDSRLELLPEFATGLLGLEGFSHVIVVCWLHRVPDDLRTVEQAPVAPGLPVVGTFATRSQKRPNPLAVSVVEVGAVDGSGLTVRGLDAIDGTPVVDIKPYLPPYDSRPKARLPKWVWA